LSAALTVLIVLRVDRKKKILFARVFCYLCVDLRALLLDFEIKASKKTVVGALTRLVHSLVHFRALRNEWRERSYFKKLHHPARTLNKRALFDARHLRLHPSHFVKAKGNYFLRVSDCLALGVLGDNYFERASH